MVNQGGIRNVVLWYDIGYTDGCTEIPPIGHTLRAPDITLTGEYHPAWDRLFNQLEVPEAFPDLMRCSYIRMEFFYNNSQDSNIYYGWIDEVILRSDTQNQPVTWIKWHVDWWRTYNSLMTFGSGFVIRRPVGQLGWRDNEYWQNYPYRYTEATDNGVELVHTIGPDNAMWVFFTVIEKSSSNVTYLTQYFFPVSNQNRHMKLTDGGNQFKTYYLELVLNGQFLSWFGIAMDSITGVWLLPSPPSGYVWYDNATQCYTCDVTHIDLKNTPHMDDDYAVFRTRTLNGELAGTWITDFTGSLSEELYSTEVNRPHVTGCLRETIGCVPFGRYILQYRYRYRISATEVILRISFNNQEHTTTPPEAEGVTFDMPCPMFDVTTNNWSSYAFTGQRDYDRNMRNLRTLSTTVEGSVSSLISGAVVGGMIGSAGGPVGMGTGAVIGAGAGIVKGLIDLNVTNDKIQDETDRLHAKQAEGLALIGDGNDIVLFGTRPRLINMWMDGYSAQKAEHSMTVQGIKVGMATDDCASLITAGGPMQISNLIVHGNVPVQAKNWTRRKFADGVRIIARGNDVEDQ